MATHHAWTTNARDALTGGDLEFFKQEVRVMIAGVDAASSSTAAGERYAKMREVLERAVVSPDIPQAAAAVGELAVICGNCHAEGRGPTFTAQGSEEAGDATKDHMQRHQWALDQLWDGIAGPFEPSWQQGEMALRELPLHSERWGNLEIAQRQQIDRWAHRVHKLGRRAMNAKTPQQRAGVLAEMIESCGGCHSLLGGGPLSAP